MNKANEAKIIQSKPKVCPMILVHAFKRERKRPLGVNMSKVFPFLDLCHHRMIAVACEANPLSFKRRVVRVCIGVLYLLFYLINEQEKI